MNNEIASYRQPSRKPDPMHPALEASLAMAVAAVSLSCAGVRSCFRGINGYVANACTGIGLISQRSHPNYLVRFVNSLPTLPSASSGFFARMDF